MRPPRSCRLLLLLFCFSTTARARPQENQPPSVSADEDKTDAHSTISSSITPEGKELNIKDGFFAPGSWQPVVSDTKPTLHQLQIDQDRSRVRLETGDGGKQRGGKSENMDTTLVQSPVNQTARAKQTPVLGVSIQSLTNQLLGSDYFEKDSDESDRDSGEDNTSDSMVEEDVRTPPKLKSQTKNKQNNQQSKTSTKITSTTTQSYAESEETNNKGIAVPVIIEDDEDVEKTIEKLSYAEPLSVTQIIASTTPKKKLTKVTNPPATTTTTTTTTTTSKPHYETTSSDGVSTWILLSGSSSTTPTIKRKNNKTPSTSFTKVTEGTTSGGLYKTSESHLSSIYSTSTTYKPAKLTSTQSFSVTPASDVANQTAQTIEFFKHTRTRKPHPTRSTTTASTTPIPESTTKHRPSAQVSSTQKVLSRVTTIKPPVVTIIRLPETTPASVQDIVSDSSENELEDTTITTEDTTEVTTKRTRRPTSGNKKRKKNKNRRRRPTKKPGSSEDPESKTDEVNAVSSNNKVSIKERPLSTRIYNYLAREVMPSVGVGLIGLVVTAGLAGLFMYPFGGGLVTRRTYEEAGPNHRLPPSPYYHHGEYEGEVDSGQSEEEVFGKLIEGMNDKGEFTYSGIGDGTAGYAGPPEALNEQDNRYKTGGSRIEDTAAYRPSAGNQNIRYGGGRIDDTRIRYETVQQGSANYGQAPGMGESKESPSYPPKYESSLQVDNSDDQYKYSVMTRSGEVDDSREAQPVYSVGTKQYSVGSVHVDSNPHVRTVGSVSPDSTGFSGAYYKPQYVEAQPYIDDMYKGLAVVGSKNYGNVQVDSKSSAVHSSVPVDTEFKSANAAENKPAGNQSQNRRVSTDSKQQQHYRDLIGTQPRSGGTIVAVSVTKQTDKEHDSKFRPIPADKANDTDSNEHSASDRTLEVQSDFSNERQSDPFIYKGYSDVQADIASRLSPELQKRGTVYSGIVEHGPRSLRQRRNVQSSSKSSVDIRDNEIEGGNKIDYTLKKDKTKESSSQLEVSSKPSTVVMSVGNEEGAMVQNLTTEMTDVTSSDIEMTTTLTGDINDNETVTEVETGTTTLETSSASKDYILNKDSNKYNDEIKQNKTEAMTTTTTTTTTMTTTTNTPRVTTRRNAAIIKRTNTTDLVTKIPDSQFSLLALFRRIARFKLQMGLNLLKSTSQAFTNYIEGVQKKIDKGYYSFNSRSRDSKRYKRAVEKSEVKGKKLEEQLRYQSKKQHISILKTIEKAIMN